MSCDLDGATLLGRWPGARPGSPQGRAGAVDALERRPARAPSGRCCTPRTSCCAARRGAALSVARIDYSSTLRFAGIGNVSGIVIDGDTRRTLVSHNGIVGNNMRKVQEFTADFPAGALCILHSDGIQTQWDLGAYRAWPCAPRRSSRPC
jgi:hypothetical protein